MRVGFVPSRCSSKYNEAESHRDCDAIIQQLSALSHLGPHRNIDHPGAYTSDWASLAFNEASSGCILNLTVSGRRTKAARSSSKCMPRVCSISLRILEMYIDKNYNSLIEPHFCKKTKIHYSEPLSLLPAASPMEAVPFPADTCLPLERHDQFLHSVFCLRIFEL